MGMSVSKYRPSQQFDTFTKARLVLLVGLILIGASAISTPTHAATNLLSATPNLLGQNEVKLKNLDKKFNLKREKIEDKAKTVEKAKTEAEQVAQIKQDTAKQIEELKNRVAQLDDMFVKVTKNDPSFLGNSYALGNCTWYVKQKRPDIGNFWGNANMWYYAAERAGFNVGTKAKIGAIGVTQEGWAGHVVYVEKVSLDGTRVTISEMNYAGLYNMNTRTVPYTDFKYIYEL